ncbi:MAG: prepilin-type N-terminal cleavage/methylation domain-containing protein [candidate division WOR-3 bacterium]|nr:prepilin-type N-terminal cleavage/methylation domain-containing protein [candidate division WOR-3 bacterium]
MRNKGFTLIELLVVILIIGILLALVIPNFVLFQERARRSSVKNNMHVLQTALEAYATDHFGVYPNEDNSDWTDEENMIYCYFPGGDPIGIEGEPRYGPAPTNPYTGRRYNDPDGEVDNDMDYEGYFGELEPGQNAIKDGAGTDYEDCFYLDVESESEMPGSIEVCTYVSEMEAVEEYGICGFGKDVIIPMYDLKPDAEEPDDEEYWIFFILHN